LVNDTERAAAIFFAAIQWKKELPEEIRGTVIQADKKIEEAIKWENLTFGNIEKNLLFVYL
jgi:hypothetical protein